MRVSLAPATARVAAQVTALQAFNNIDELKVEVTKYCNEDAINTDKYGDINEWDVSQVTSMSELFRGFGSCNPPIQDWDVSNVGNFGYMFYQATTFNNDISQWDVSKGTNFYAMFYQATTFNTNISQWDVSKGTDFRGMFEGATSFNNDISQWDVSQGTDFRFMFQIATSFNNDISQWDVSKGTYFQQMFYRATSFNNDISQWDVSQGVNFINMFRDATSFNTNISQWDVSKGTDFRFMFYQATSFNNDISQWDVSKGTDFSYMFYGATSFNNDISQWDVSKSTLFRSMFYQATTFNNNISQWNVSKGTDFRYMFYGATSFNNDISQWDVSKSTLFYAMFYQATTFNNNISQWNVSKGTDFGFMFYQATSFNNDISQWDVSKSTLFGYMFYQATTFNTNISQWDVSKGTDFGSMFEGATSFNCCSISEWPLAARNSCPKIALCTTRPSAQPSKQPSAVPSTPPSAQLSKQPSAVPSTPPSKQPSTDPSIQPSLKPQFLAPSSPTKSSSLPEAARTSSITIMLIIGGCLFAFISFVLAIFYRRKKNRTSRMNSYKAFARDDSGEIFGDDNGLDVADTDHESSVRIALRSDLNVDINIPHTTVIDINHPSMWAISFDQLLEVRDQAMNLFKEKEEDFDSKTLRDINEAIIIPVCQRTKTSYALYKNPNGLILNVFVSHSWDEPFRAFVDSIEQVYLHSLEKPALWICAFGLVQGSSDEIKAQLGVGDTPLDESPFVKALQAADKYLVVRNTKTDLCSRIWCICEVMYAKKYKLIPSNTLIAGPNAFTDTTISCLEAKCFDINDKAKILKKLLNEHNHADIDEYIAKFRTFSNNQK